MSWVYKYCSLWRGVVRCKGGKCSFALPKQIESWNPEWTDDIYVKPCTTLVDWIYRLRMANAGLNTSKSKLIPPSPHSRPVSRTLCCPSYCLRFSRPPYLWFTNRLWSQISAFSGFVSPWRTNTSLRVSPLPALSICCTLSNLSALKLKDPNKAIRNFF